MEVEGDKQIHEAPSIWGPGVERDIVQHRDMDIERIIKEKTQSTWNGMSENNWRRNKMGQDQEHRDSEQARMHPRHNSQNSAKKTTVLRTYFKNGQLQVS